MTLYPQRDGLDSLQQQKSTERREDGPGRPLVDAAASAEKRAFPEMIGVDQSVIRRVRLAEQREARPACCSQGKLPLSTIAPPSVVPCPPMNLVSECTTMSAPYSIGRSRIGVATVLSTISGTPWRWATFAKASMSQMFPAGLPTLSQKTARVFSSISVSIDLRIDRFPRSAR